MGFSDSGRSIEEDTFGEIIERYQQTEIFEFFLDFISIIFKAKGEFISSQIMTKCINFLLIKVLVGYIRESLTHLEEPVFNKLFLLS
jgi:hypothetical protein